MKLTLTAQTHIGRILCLMLMTFASAGLLHAQDDFEDLLHQEVENIHPVYKPVIGIGVGSFSYLGDIKNNFFNPTIGTMGYKLSLATYIDNLHYFKGEFFFMGGKFNGNERSYTDPMKNFNFQTSIYNFGIDVNYDFRHLYKNKAAKIHPFVSLGIGTLFFNSSTDSIGYYYDEGTGTAAQSKYHYWTDGTIRDLPQSTPDPSLSHLMRRDYNYETPLRGYDWGLGQYAQYAFVIPVDFGFDLQLSDRMMLRVGNSFTYTFSDNIDHVSSKNKSGRIGKKGNDMYNFTYISLHLDLFSSAKMLKVDRLFREMEFDPMLMGDEDSDGWMDGWDQCPGTPLGVATDSTGCPLDSDDDGVYDYQDKEPFSRQGAFVNAEGVEISADDVAALINQSMAVGHNEVDLYIRKPDSYRKKGSGLPIPDKFKPVDTDKDGYISFDEMLKEIDRYFDFQSDLTAGDIYELNSFFFAQ